MSDYQENFEMATRGLSPSFIHQALQLPTMRLDASERRPAVWAAILSGAGLGLLWGIVARIWMRLISTQPEFSIPGTAAILIIASLFGAFVGLAFAARRRGWRRWGHYVSRVLAVVFFIPFGIAGGLPLMLTVLVATLGLTRRAAVGWWVVAGLTLLLANATDIRVPPSLVISAVVGALALTAWRWLVGRGGPRFLQADVWLERIGRASVLLLAAFGFWTVASEIVTDKPGGFGLVYVLIYLILLCPLFLALRIGLEPSTPAGSRDTTLPSYG